MNSQPHSAPTVGPRPAEGERSAGQQAFTLIELLIVIAIIGVLAAIALPQLMAARRAAAEQAVVSQLRVMATNQQLFYPNPVPLSPSPLDDLTPRFARLHELNSFSNNVFGDTYRTYLVVSPRVRYSMIPLWPSMDSLRGQFVIQATEQNVTNGFIYQVDESGNIVKIR